MSLLEMLYYDLVEEKEPDTPEYRENRDIRGRLMDDLQKTMGDDMAEKVAAIHDGHEIMECQRYFRYGIQLGLELLGLLV